MPFRPYDLYRRFSARRTPSNRFQTAVARLAVVALLGAAVSTVAMAQLPDEMDMGGVHMKLIFKAAPVVMLTVTPATVEVDAKTNTAIVKFANTGKDTLHADVAAQFAEPGTANSSATSDDHWSLVPWIQDLPKDITLAPHETKTVTLHLKVPNKPAAGDYTAYVGAQDKWAKVVYHAK